MECAERFARERGAEHLWLEVSSVNAPAVHAYRRMGFTFCGLDTTLYGGTPAAAPAAEAAHGRLPQRAGSYAPARPAAARSVRDHPEGCSLAADRPTLTCDMYNG
ncbi:hypothetical protein GCM10010205_10120 [Streptomyces nojiriensis]|uniref:GNAT family N-acetyltransferase n=1 Tax=Streptomyces nojiriensis TaxID=66374 RepID=UPI0019C7EDF3|nr:hypothetical protein GCM10010205_10120 [Streptomyces nojiriensis]